MGLNTILYSLSIDYYKAMKVNLFDCTGIKTIHKLGGESDNGRFEED